MSRGAGQCCRAGLRWHRRPPPRRATRDRLRFDPKAQCPSPSQSGSGSRRRRPPAPARAQLLEALQRRKREWQRLQQRYQALDAEALRARARAAGGARAGRRVHCGGDGAVACGERLAPGVRLRASGPGTAPLQTPPPEPGPAPDRNRHATAGAHPNSSSAPEVDTDHSTDQSPAEAVPHGTAAAPEGPGAGRAADAAAECGLGGDAGPMGREEGHDEWDAEAEAAYRKYHAKDALYGAGGEAEQEDELPEARATRLHRCGTFSQNRAPSPSVWGSSFPCRFPAECSPSTVVARSRICPPKRLPIRE